MSNEHNVIDNVSNNTTENQEPNPTGEVVKILKKRGRKPSGKVLDIKSIEQKQFKSSLDPEKECLILHLPLTTKDITKIGKKLEDINENDYSNKTGACARPNH